MRSRRGTDRKGHIIGLIMTLELFLEPRELNSNFCIRGKLLVMWKPVIISNFFLSWLVNCSYNGKIQSTFASQQRASQNPMMYLVNSGRFIRLTCNRK